MAKKFKDYFGLDGIINLVLVIIPITSLVCGVLTRIQEKKYVAAIVRLFVGWNIIWILDIFFMITEGHIFRLLDM